MKIKALLYCCKATKKNDYLTKIWINQYELSSLKEVVEQDTLNGKIVCECEVETEELTQIGCGGDIFITQTLDYFEILRHSCLKMEELSDYLYNPDKDSKGYALHLTNVKVFFVIFPFFR